MKLLGFAALALALAACSSPKPPAASPTTASGVKEKVNVCPPDHQIECEPDDDDVPPEEKKDPEAKAKAKTNSKAQVIKPAHVERPTPTRRN